eukprot:CAMPEP_0174267102 /NCGR_PEP_ID=MMETSP0439-20130205/32446_1 /TAXON_ID=0 /ORGANISM="Stereomyxa ramosa, Strain Chinc5" /LENGTH=222 /DNA_ID=CAMNT_0015354417 /DNA_START=764 /DNA_END=1429 /DNA_ORIENTATION=-
MAWVVTYDWVVQMTVIMMLVLLSEAIVDWVKHCFIQKFNHLAPDLYHKYFAVLCSDLLAQQLNHHNSLDNNYAVSRRVGFVPIPIACVVVRVIAQVIPVSSVSVIYALTCGLLFWCCLFALKALLHVQLLGMCVRVSHWSKDTSTTDNSDEKEIDDSDSDSNSNSNSNNKKESNKKQKEEIGRNDKKKVIRKSKSDEISRSVKHRPTVDFFDDSEIQYLTSV